MAGRMHVQPSQAGSYSPPAPPSTEQAICAGACVLVGGFSVFGLTVAVASISPYLIPVVGITAALSTAGLAIGTLDGSINSRTITALPDQLAGLYNKHRTAIIRTGLAATVIATCLGQYVPLVFAIGFSLAACYKDRVRSTGE